MDILNTWQFFAFGSAFFAALTAIFGKIGVEEVSSDLATWIRTIVIFFVVSLILSGRNEWQLRSVDGRTYLFLILSGLATGASWLCYYHALKLGPASRVAPVDKFSVVLTVFLAAAVLGESLNWKAIMGTILITAGAILMIFS